MTLDEAIAHAREVAEEQRKACDLAWIWDNPDNIKKCAEEHDQLAEWLEELKFLKQWKSDIMEEFCRYDVSSFEELIANARNKAIDDFVERLTTYLGIENATKYGNENAEQMRNSYGTFMNYEIAESIKDVAKQLKAGEK